MLKVLVLLSLFSVSLISGTRYFATPGKATVFPSNYSSIAPHLYVYPSFVTANVSQTFTISVVVSNLTKGSVPDPYGSLPAFIPLGNMYGFDVQFSWNPTIIHCVGHTVTAPYESYSTPIPPSPYAGVLHGYSAENKSIISAKDVVNETGNIPGAHDASVTAWFACATMYPAAAFNGNGTIFTMVFKVLTRGESPLKIVDATLADVNGNPIGKSASTGQWLNDPASGAFRLGAPVADYTYWPSIGVVNKPMSFTALVTENLTAIEEYMWDFKDGNRINTTTPTVDHNYTSSNIYSVTLRVIDEHGVQSVNVTKNVMVAASRDLQATNVALSQYRINPNMTLTITPTVSNLGNAIFPFNENCMLRLYYNTSSLAGNTTWVLVKNMTNVLIPNGGYKVLSVTLNSSSLPEHEVYYYFKLNVTGIPEGYEANTANNVKLSGAVFYTFTIIHEPSVTSFTFGYTRISVLELPVIKGENITFSITVLNNGTSSDTFNVTLYANGSAIKTWRTSSLQAYTSQTLGWLHVLDVGYYNLTAAATAGNVSSVKQGFLRVITPPLLSVKYTPQSPLIGQAVTINGSGSVHQDPKGKITGYTWEIFAPGADPNTNLPVKSISGANATVIAYTFNTTGNWTVRLVVADNYQLSYDSRRPATGAYRCDVVISVAQGGIPIEWIVAIVVGAIAVVAVVVFVMLRRRRAGVKEEPKVQQ